MNCLATLDLPEPFLLAWTSVLLSEYTRMVLNPRSFASLIPSMMAILSASVLLFLDTPRILRLNFSTSFPLLSSKQTPIPQKLSLTLASQYTTAWIMGEHQVGVCLLNLCEFAKYAGHVKFPVRRSATDALDVEEDSCTHFLGYLMVCETSLVLIVSTHIVAIQPLRMQ